MSWDRALPAERPGLKRQGDKRVSGTHSALCREGRTFLRAGPCSADLSTPVSLPKLRSPSSCLFCIWVCFF